MRLEFGTQPAAISVSPGRYSYHVYIYIFICIFICIYIYIFICICIRGCFGYPFETQKGLLGVIYYVMIGTSESDIQRGRIFMTELAVHNLKVSINGENGYTIEKIEYDDAEILRGIPFHEFNTSVCHCNAEELTIIEQTPERIVVSLSAKTEYFHADETIFIGDSHIERKQTYRITKDFHGHFLQRFTIKGSDIRYTYPIHVYEAPISQVPPLRQDISWAVPLPAHVWHTDENVIVYGVNQNEGRGSPDAFQTEDTETLSIGVRYPDRTGQAEGFAFYTGSRPLGDADFSKGQTVILTEFVMAKKREDEPLLEAEKMAAQILLKEPPAPIDYAGVSQKLAGYFKNCGLWEEDVFGKGCGWFRNMWTYTAFGTPKKDPYYDLGWGEGYGAATISALARYMERTGDDFSKQIDQMSRGMWFFLREQKVPGAYYDRYFEKTKEFCDFTVDKRIWTHSLGEIGLQLIQLYHDVPDYREDVRTIWFNTAKDIADFMLTQQKADGDINDGFEADNREANPKPHRIPARAVFCGLWVHLYRFTKDQKYLNAARRLALAVKPEIDRYEFFNQMIDAFGHSSNPPSPIEIYDGENSAYALQGLTELYLETKDEEILSLCKKCAAYLISWMYFYNIDTGHNGVTRGGTVCRMPDYPLLYLGAGSFGYVPLVRLSKATGDAFYHRMAAELLTCVSKYFFSAPGKPFDNGLVHAIDQSNCLYWGPDKAGQLDTGMTSGMALMLMEYTIKFV